MGFPKKWTPDPKIEEFFENPLFEKFKDAKNDIQRITLAKLDLASSPEEYRNLFIEAFAEYEEQTHEIWKTEGKILSYGSLVSMIGSSRTPPMVRLRAIELFTRMNGDFPKSGPLIAIQNNNFNDGEYTEMLQQARDMRALRKGNNGSSSSGTP